MREILLFHREAGRVICDQCAHRCEIPDGARGQCGVLVNKDDVIYSLVSDRVCAAHIDPIERKSFLHVLPGSRSMSVASMGCNFHCPHCQSYELSQVKPNAVIAGHYVRPDEITAHALASGCSSIAFTYTEPTVYLDLVHDVARRAREAGLATLFATNGHMTPESISLIGPHLTAVGIDLKCLSETSYRSFCGGSLGPVLATIEAMRGIGVWVEVSTVLVPGVCDALDEVRSIARYLASIDPEIPWQVVRFEPSHELKHLPATRAGLLAEALACGRETGLHHVYAPGLMGKEGAESTFCPGCGSLLIERFGLELRWCRLKSGGCPDCGRRLGGVW
ncbi:MAG: AmmeMemoRadiSam system radical SAM enzyme [Planctomycetota bacterium]